MLSAELLLLLLLVLQDNLQTKLLIILSKSVNGVFTFVNYNSSFSPLFSPLYSPLLITLKIDIKELAAVKIRHHSISQVVDGGANFSHLLLDCDYTYDPGDIKLVVRWFFNDAPEPIYQWIPSSDTRYVGELLRPFFDLEHRLGEDRFTKYRAIRLVSRRKGKEKSSNLEDQSSLPVTLAGKYACLISSINSQDSKHGQLVVFGKSGKVRLAFEKLIFNFFSFQCHQRSLSLAC